MEAIKRLTNSKKIHKLKTHENSQKRSSRAEVNSSSSDACGIPNNRSTRYSGNDQVYSAEELEMKPLINKHSNVNLSTRHVLFKTSSDDSDDTCNKRFSSALLLESTPPLSHFYVENQTEVKLESCFNTEELLQGKGMSSCKKDKIKQKHSKQDIGKMKNMTSKKLRQFPVPGQRHLCNFDKLAYEGYSLINELEDKPKKVTQSGTRFPNEKSEISTSSQSSSLHDFRVTLSDIIPVSPQSNTSRSHSRSQEQTRSSHRLFNANSISKHYRADSDQHQRSAPLKQDQSELYKFPSGVLRRANRQTLCSDRDYSNVHLGTSRVHREPEQNSQIHFSEYLNQHNTSCSKITHRPTPDEKNYIITISEDENDIKEQGEETE